MKGKNEYRVSLLVGGVGRSYVVDAAWPGAAVKKAKRIAEKLHPGEKITEDGKLELLAEQKELFAGAELGVARPVFGEGGSDATQV